MAPRKIKKEPQVETVAMSSVGTLPKKASPFVMKEEDPRRRAARSGAPSVATRLHDHAPVPTPPEDDDDSDECMLMEVRPRIKIQPGEELLGQLGANTSVSFMSNPAFQAIGQKLKEVNDTLGTLQSLGIQKVASLPELVLVGDQSAGKSSIMSAIAGLNLPHNTGVCTRCPVHIRLSRAVASEWSCRITLQLHYDFRPENGPITQNDVTRSNPFPPWVKQNLEQKEFIMFREKVDCIEHALRWAQVAILNHGDDHEQYIPRSGSDSGSESEEAEALERAEAHTKAKFSPNTVALEIKGPDLPDLSFYDLPGVFANARHVEDQYLADVVKNLTREYISHEKAIILWAVPMNTDAETSTTFSIIREMNAVKRCLGVMTKADLLPSRGHKQWIDMLEGTIHRNGLGYFITSRPDKDGLDEQEAWEEAFFNRRVHESHAETPIWPVEFAEYDDQCGVVRLKDFLSRKLAEDFAKSLPALKAILHERLHEVVSKLKTLPELPPNPELEIRQALYQFTTLARTCLKEPGFQDAWKNQEKEFSSAILKMKPKYIVKPPVSSVINLESESPNSTPNPTPKRRSTATHYSDVQSTPSRRRINAGSSMPVSGSGSVKLEETPHSQRMNSVAPVATPAGLRTDAMPPRSRSLEEIRTIIESKRQPGMPNSIPDSVYEAFCKESVQPWGRATHNFLGETMKLVHIEMHKALDNAFATLKKRSVYREAKNHLNAFLKTHRENLMAKLNYTYGLERYQLYTSNRKFFEINQESELRELTRHRHHYRWLTHTGQLSNERPRPYDELTEEEKASEAARMTKEGPKMGKDAYQQELEVAAYVRGYYLTAALRFIDNASLHMISGTFPAVAESINMHLDQKLGLLNQPEGALFERLMEEEPKTAELRNQLKEDKKKFDKALASILALEMSSNNAGDGGDGDDYMEIEDGDPAMMSGALNGSSIYGDVI